jgi:ribosomal protein L11 methylase PrmA
MAKNTSNNVRVWKLVTVTLARSADEFASSVLFELGTTGIITLEENAEVRNARCLLRREHRPCRYRERHHSGFARVGRGADLLTISISTVENADWMQKWKEGFEPVVISRRLLIAPSWRLPADPEGREVIQIDPGMAFGTGTHETTRLCLELIERYWRGGSLLDVGTGQEYSR